MFSIELLSQFTIRIFSVLKPFSLFFADYEDLPTRDQMWAPAPHELDPDIWPPPPDRDPNAWPPPTSVEHKYVAQKVQLN